MKRCSKLFPKFLFIILKNKNDKWSEKEKPNREHKIKEEENLSDDCKTLLAEGLSFVTVNRLKNLMSKWEGPVTDRDFGKLIGLLNIDTNEDFMKDCKESFEALDRDEQKIINKEIGGANSKLLRENFLNVIDGNL